ncbi:MAG: AAA family ATPase [Marivita sp.]|uniref:bifunctional aminoglycoside phosphotransferase/ATP-binding protein n=1 Tax=Marivita sp. TaxID=2003365 RepID=UPI003EF775E3
MGEQSQARVISFLSDGKNLPERAPVDVIRTHGAIVFLSGAAAYKIKRDVRYDYLDFSSLQKRHDMLRRELELNAPAAPSIYRDVIAVTQDADGHLHLDGTGDVVEWVLRMHRFDTADALDKVAERGALDDAMAARLGETIAAYHENADPRGHTSGADLIHAIVDELNTAFATMHDALGRAPVARYRAGLERTFATLWTTLDARGQAGHVRRCHGDLHLRNIVLLEGVPTPFDALEFNETLGTCDVLYDLAFLLMDLRHKGLDRAANIVLNSYLMQSRTGDHHAALSLLPLFVSMRAAIRAMVGVQAARLDPDDMTRLPEARAYLAEALACLDPAPAHLIAIGGLSGTGKTVLAAALAPLIGAAPGAVHLRSDLERKKLFGVAPLTPLPPPAYGPEASAQVYAIMRDKARAVLSGGHCVVLDATWRGEDERACLPALAREAGARFTGFWLVAETAVLETRVSARHGDASDADAAVVGQQARQTHAPASWARIDASGSPDETIARVLAFLNRPRKPGPSGPQDTEHRHAR